ncbi:MAG: GNAT family N-acetyltransferase [Candidatus Nanopelagicales bacterium]
MSTDLSSFLPDGLAVRPPRLGDSGTPVLEDRDAILALCRDAEVRAIGESDTTADEIDEMFTLPNTDLEHTLMVHDGDELVGFVWTECDAASGESWVDVYVGPERTDVADAFVAFGTALAREHSAAHPEIEQWSLRSGCFATDAETSGALERGGFERVRRFWRMRLDLEGYDAVAPVLPPGVEILDGFDPANRRTTYEVQSAAFDDHWNHTMRPFDEWFGFFDQPYLDPTGWWLLTVDGEPAAVCILDDSRREISEGYVRSLGVLRDHRGQGLAKLLLERAFAMYAERGLRGVQLGVDSTSPTGANHLYEGVGMRPHRVIDAWALWLTAEVPAG